MEIPGNPGTLYTHKDGKVWLQLKLNGPGFTRSDWLMLFPCEAALTPLKPKPFNIYTYIHIKFIDHPIARGRMKVPGNPGTFYTHKDGKVWL